MANKLSSIALATSLLIPFYVHADEPGKHPAYLHALTDLRDARWNLEHRPGDAAVSGQEDIAIREIDKAGGEIKKAAIEDDKNLRDKPREDAKLDHPGRLHHAEELLNKARQDLSEEEDNPKDREIKHKAIEHIEVALKATHRAIEDVERHK